MTNRSPRALGYLLGVALLALPMASIADLKSQSDNMFNSMVNVTRPEVAMGARRGVISGGQLTVKNKIMDFSLYTFQPPRINVGCGGIDAFMGSFSFISKEQAVQALRAIASAALAYAFKLALKAMCPSCASTMDELKAKMDSWNINNLNSCEIGEKIANAAVGEGTPGNRMFARVGVAVGLRTDDADAANQGEATSAAKALADKDPALHAAMQDGNQVWRALIKTNAGSWLSDASPEMMEDIMSLTGTIVACTSGVAGCTPGAPGAPEGGQEGEQIVRPFQGPLHLEDIVEGSDTSNKVAKVLRCNDGKGQDECLDVVTQTRPTTKGLNVQIEDILNGPAGVGGLLAARVAGNRGPTGEEDGLLSNSGVYTALAVRLARRDLYAAQNYVSSFRDVIAAEIAYTIAKNDILIAAHALSLSKSRGSGQVLEMLSKKNRELFDEYRRYIQAAQNNTAMLDYVYRVLEATDRPDPIAIPIGAGN